MENNKRTLKSSANLQDILNFIKNHFKNKEFDKVEKIAPALYQHGIQSSNLDEKKYSIQAAIYYGVSRSNQMIKNDNRLCAAEYLMNTNELYLRYLQHGYDLIQPVNIIENFFYNILNSGKRKYGENKLKDYRGCIIDALNSNDEVLKQNLVFGMIRLDKICGFLSEELDNPKPEARKFKIELKRALAYQLGGKLRFSERTSTNEILICIKDDYSQKFTRFISCIESILGSNYSEMKSKWKSLTETFKHVSIYFVPEERKLDTLFISLLKRSFNLLYREDSFNVEMYEEICHTIEDEVDRLKSYPITFNHYLNEFYLSLQKALEEEYQKFNQKYKPDPQIMEVTKHYPLIKGRVFDLDINIRNSTGNDLAKNMVLKILDYGDKLFIQCPEISIGYVP